MRVKTIAVGGPRTVRWRGEEVTTSIFKEPVPGPLTVRPHNLAGDRQSDLRVHGGEYKAVYAYAAEHYPFWEAQLGRRLEPAHFGENLTIEEFEEPAVCIGDTFRVGTAVLEATIPRLPCHKLAIRFANPGMVKTFTQAGRWGIYFRVVSEGRIAVGDAVERIETDPRRVPVYEVARVYVADRGDREAVARLVAHPRLDPGWREHFRRILDGDDAGEAPG